MAFLIGVLAPCASIAEPVANWKEFNTNKIVVPITGADTNSPTFGDGVTPNSSQAAWIAGAFGTVDAPRSVTLAVGETLTVSGSVVLTGGSNNNNQFRFGVFGDGGQFALDDGSNWVGGWLHSSGSVPTSNLWMGRTDGPFISTAGNAVNQNSIKTRTGTFDGDSVTPFEFSMSITRSSATTVDVLSLLTGGDGDLSEEFALEGIETPIFTYSALGWLFGGSSAVEQVAYSNVEFSVAGRGDARITAIRVVGTSVEIDYEGIEGRSYAVDASLDMMDWEAELDDSLAASGTYIDDLAARFKGVIPSRIFYRVRELAP